MMYGLVSIFLKVNCQELLVLSFNFGSVHVGHASADLGKIHPRKIRPSLEKSSQVNFVRMKIHSQFNP
jgi:hypothetical protein